jgi:site-specific recombinase XerD
LKRDVADYKEHLDAQQQISIANLARDKEQQDARAAASQRRAVEWDERAAASQRRVYEYLEGRKPAR